ncbi:hypothetical protein C8Q70DRAFT_234850 [Cubamyces menziesii]|nr:hypothetical protein C8Q70DRAFT_234850 [Cubamyces menziesii]
MSVPGWSRSFSLETSPLRSMDRPMEYRCGIYRSYAWRNHSHFTAPQRDMTAAALTLHHPKATPHGYATCIAIFSGEASSVGVGVGHRPRKRIDLQDIQLDMELNQAFTDVSI